MRAGEPANEGFAEPDAGDSDPCTPLAGFRVRVLVFKGARWEETLDCHPEPGNASPWRRRTMQVSFVDPPNLGAYLETCPLSFGNVYAASSGKSESHCAPQS